MAPGAFGGCFAVGVFLGIFSVALPAGVVECFHRLYFVIGVVAFAASLFGNIIGINEVVVARLALESFILMHFVRECHVTVLGFQADRFRIIMREGRRSDDQEKCAEEYDQ